MTDLDALKEDLAYLRERGDLAAALTATTAELYRLIEEVEYLRGERAAVVAWLRDIPSVMLDEAAYAIERGEHRREEEK
jgi:hypothetical protein